MCHFYVENFILFGFSDLRAVGAFIGGRPQHSSMSRSECSSMLFSGEVFDREVDRFYFILVLPFIRAIICSTLVYSVSTLHIAAFISNVVSEYIDIQQFHLASLTLT